MPSGSGLTIHTDDVHTSGDTMGNFGTQVTSGGQTLETLGNDLSSHANADKSGVGKIISTAMGKVTSIAGTVFKEGGRVATEAGKCLHLCASNHETNEENVTGSFHNVTSDHPSSHSAPHSTSSSSSPVHGQPQPVKPMTIPKSPHQTEGGPSSPAPSESGEPPVSIPKSPHPDTDGGPSHSDDEPTSPQSTHSGSPAGSAATKPNQDYLGNPDFRSTPEDRANFKNNYPNYNDHVDAVNEAKKNDPSLANIPEEDLVAVRAYTTNDHYQEMNNALRNDDPAGLQQYDSHIRTTTSGLNQMPSAGYTTVTRTIAVDPKDLPALKQNYAPDNTVTENGFFSATKGKDSGFWGGVSMRVDSADGRVLGPLSTKPTENEVLFPPGMQHVVTGQKVDPANNNHLTIYSEQ
ncbi:MAG TPA: ADP-ribosyltransferase [Pseudonocardiaceae bacterium]|jgi:hypothetical protein|nr:ADP-ribosyltransferase [Pseudonocardiaceae bacterium]